MLELLAFEMILLDDGFVFFYVCILECDLLVAVNNSKMVSFPISLFYILGSVLDDYCSLLDHADPVSKFLCFVEVMSRQDYGALHAPKALEDLPHVHSAQRV